MSAFPVIEGYRAELRALSFPRVDDAGMVELRRRGAEAHHSSAIEGIHPTPELEALFDMLLEERAPPDVSGPYVDRYIMEQLVPQDRALAPMREAV